MRSGELEEFENSFLFRTAFREFIRNLSRLADDLLPNVFVSIDDFLPVKTLTQISDIYSIFFNQFSIISDDSIILRNPMPEQRIKDNAYLIFYSKLFTDFH